MVFLRRYSGVRLISERYCALVLSSAGEITDSREDGIRLPGCRGVLLLASSSRARLIGGELPKMFSGPSYMALVVLTPPTNDVDAEGR